jgi:CelD/BcsL family acetyltransferase involved in cellulose biosynthesis
VALDLARDGLIKVCRLIVDERVTACRLAFMTGDGVYLSHAGHDPDWARYRVGTTLTLECLQAAVRAQQHVVHLGTGDDDSKRRWRPEARRLNRLHIMAPTRRGMITGRLAERILLVIAAVRARLPISP